MSHDIYNDNLNEIKNRNNMIGEADQCMVRDRDECFVDFANSWQFIKA